MNHLEGTPLQEMVAGVVGTVASAFVLAGIFNKILHILGLPPNSNASQPSAAVIDSSPTNNTAVEQPRFGGRGRYLLPSTGLADVGGRFLGRKVAKGEVAPPNSIILLMGEQASFLTALKEELA